MTVYAQFSMVRVGDLLSADRLNGRIWADIGRGLGDCDLVVRSSRREPFIEEDIDGLRVHHIPERLGRLAYLQQAHRLARTRLGAARLWDASDPVLDAIVPSQAARRTGRPLSIHVQGQVLHPASSNPTWRRLLVRHVALHHLRQATSIRAISDTTKRELEAEGFDPATVHVVPSRVDVKEFTPARSKQKAKENVRLPDGPIVGFVGRLHFDKDLPTLLRAFKLALERLDRASTLVIVGDGPERGAVLSLVAQLDLTAHVRLVGKVPHEQVREYLRSFDVLVMSSRDEGLPRVILESFACGVPVVATQVGGIPEIVQDHVTGFCVPAGSPSGLADRLTQILRGGELARMGAMARSLVETRYSWQRGSAALVTYLRGGIDLP